MHRIVLVDDQKAFRELTRKMLERDGDFEIVAEYEDGADVVGAVEELGSSLILMDIQMPQMNGFEAARRILAHDASAQIILTSMNAHSQYSGMSKEAGVMAFIAKRDLSADTLREALRSHGD